MLELVPDCCEQQQDIETNSINPSARPSATIHCIYDPLNPSINAIVSAARRLQAVLIEQGAIPPDGPFPFPPLAPAADH